MAVALTGAVLGWSLRPVFLRYRRAFVVAVAILAAAGATAYDAIDAKLSPQQDAPVVVSQVPPAVTPSSAPSSAPASSVDAWADYLDRAGRDAFAEGDYVAASRYWRDASQLSPRLAAELAGAMARAQALAADRL